MASTTGNFWHRDPLGDEIERLFGETGPGEGHARALANWNRAMTAIQTPHRRPGFKSSLSASQYNSFRIILEWWNGSTQEMALTQAARNSIEQAADIKYAESQNLDIDREAARLNESTYHNSLFLLFQLEFVHETRVLHGKDYGIFRVAHSLLTQMTTREDGSATAEGHSIGTAGRQAVEPLMTLLQKSIGACVEACPWLKRGEMKGKYPFYLWDTRERCTVIVDQLEEPPQYICVSHTWGRWLERDKPFAAIPGVPWLVPRNRKFDVDDLPNMLEKTFSPGYVWFDLLCIPQDRSERALIEISRQAIIFSNSTSVVAWLNDAQTWDGLRNAVEWLSMFYLHTSVAKIEGSYTIPELPNELYPEEYVSQGEADVEMPSPLSWFTSLWTLQEACLRPDIALVNRNWEPLTAGLTTIVTLDHLVALNNYIDKRMYQSSVVRKARKDTQADIFDENEEPDIPPCAEELGELLLETCMDELIWMSPSAIFTFGQLRQCSESRAEAIMSVVGATKWFENHVADHHTAPSEDNLLLGFYPVSFLNEAANKLGPTFYTARPGDLQYLSGAVELKNGRWEALVDAKPVGSLLPFTSSSTHISPPQKYAFASHDHPAVKHWKIQSDGSVRITQAGILTFGDEELVEKDGDDIIIAPLVDEEGKISPDSYIRHEDGQDLAEWVRGFAGPDLAPNYAVCLYQQIYFNSSIRGPQVGLLLKQVKTVGMQSVLVKVGIYLTGASRAWDISTKEVDWIVL